MALEAGTRAFKVAPSREMTKKPEKTEIDMTDKPGKLTRPKRPKITDQEALQFHSRGRPGKIEIVATKPMSTQRDLSLA